MDFMKFLTYIEHIYVYVSEMPLYTKSAYQYDNRTFIITDSFFFQEVSQNKKTIIQR